MPTGSSAVAENLWQAVPAGNDARWSESREPVIGVRTAPGSHECSPAEVFSGGAVAVDGRDVSTGFEQRAAHL